MMLRGGTAPFQIETGRWKGVPQEECVENVGLMWKWKTAITGCYVWGAVVGSRKTTSSGKCSRKAS